MVSNCVRFSVKDIPSLKGKVIIVTGANSGLGKQSVLDLARHDPKEIWLTARSTAKAESAISDIKKEVPNANIKPLPMDLSSFESVKAAARTFINASDRLDILILNAGCLATPPELTKDGYEMQFGTNHMGHALFTKLLTPILDKTVAEPNSDVRVVVVSSARVASPPEGGIQFDTLKTTQADIDGMVRYGQSKLANTLYARELARVHPNWTVISLHPGVANTNISHHMMDGKWYGKVMTILAAIFLTSIEETTLNQLWAATAPKEQIKTGEMYWPVGDLTGGKRGPYVKDDAMAKKLWDWTEKELEPFLI